MAFDYAAVARARAAYDEQVARFRIEAQAYRDRASRATDAGERQSCLDAARTLDGQAEQVRQQSRDMQRQMEAAHATDRNRSFDEMMADAHERARNRDRDRGRGNEGIER